MKVEIRTKYNNVLIYAIHNLNSRDKKLCLLVTSEQ